ncbi:MAG TPA: type II CAAX endopeptidase family protein [Actinomycetota bacterium]|jgi:hypothetical protein
MDLTPPPSPEVPAEPAWPPAIPWSPVEAIPIALLALFPIVLVGLFVRVGDTGALALGLAFEFLLATTSVLWVRARHPSSRGVLRLRSGRTWRDLGSGALGGVGLFGVTFVVLVPLYIELLTLINGAPVTLPEQPVLPLQPTAFQVSLGAVVALVAAPIAEEVFFRGFFFTALRARSRFFPAAGISAGVFALFHVTPLHMPVFFFVGLGLAYVYERRRSLAASIAAHVSFNVIGYALIAMRSLDP